MAGQPALCSRPAFVVISVLWRRSIAARTRFRSWPGSRSGSSRVLSGPSPRSSSTISASSGSSSVRRATATSAGREVERDERRAPAEVLPGADETARRQLVLRPPHEVHRLCPFQELAAAVALRELVL